MLSYPTPPAIVTTEVMGPHFTKYHLGGGRVLHHFTAACDVLFHDHPFPFVSTVLIGGYVEEVAEICDDGTLATATLERLPGTTHAVQAGTIHRLTRLIDGDCLTLIQVGDKERESGFYRADEAGVWHRYWYEADEAWRLLVPTLVLH